MRRSQSDRDFIAKAAVVIEEADEAGFWLELLVKIGIARPEDVLSLDAEANELVAIFTASKKTVTARLEKERAARKGQGRNARSKLRERAS